MKKFYRVVLLLVVFIFLSTYSPNKLDLTLETNEAFFKIQKIIILNNSLVKKNAVYEKLDQIYNKNMIWVKDKMLNIVTKITICDFCHFYRLISIQEEQYLNI